jgi:hypothetical protein
MKGILKKGLLVACIAAISLTTIDCKKDKDDNTGLLLAALLFSQGTPEYTVVMVATLRDSNGVRIRDGRARIADPTSYLTPGQGTLEDYTSCVSSNITTAASTTLDGEFTLTFRTPSLTGSLDLQATDSSTYDVTYTAATAANTCSDIANLAATTFTNTLGTGKMAVALNLSDRTNTRQIAITSSGFSVDVKSVTVTVKGEYNLLNPTIGENICDGRNATSQVTKTGTIRASETWSGGIILSGTVEVKAGAKITVEPGTVVFGQRGSSLFLTEGGSIETKGTAASPVCFTSSNSPGSRFPGDWGGIVIVSNSSTITRSSAQTEGTTPATYPGSSASASRFAYTIIEFAGNEVAPGDELNGLSMYALDNSGSGAALDRVQVHRSLDDGFEWWGGNIDGRYLVATGGLDDDFDMDEGYAGTLTNLISFKYPANCGGSFSTDPHSFEADGINSGTRSCTVTNGAVPTTCTSNPTVSNFTSIGQNITSSEGMRLREGLRGTFSNGLIYDFAAFSIRCVNDAANFPTTSSSLTNVSAKAGATAAAQAGCSFTSVSETLTSLPITSVGNVTTTDCGFGATKPDFSTLSSVSQKGAQASDTTKWWEGWTVYRGR